LNKSGDKSFKIYIGKLMNHAIDLLILGTNKGIIAYRLNDNHLPDVTSSIRLTELNDYSKFVTFEMGKSCLISKLYNESINDKTTYELKTETLIKGVFSSQSIVVKYKRVKLDFSFDENYLSVIDSIQNNFSIYSVTISETVKYSFSVIKSGNCIDLQWCPYENICAILLHNQMGKAIDHKKLLFTAAIYKLTGSTFQLIYSIEK
jgi:hypothetical protein